MSIFVNGKKIKSFNFPGGECHVKVCPRDITNRTKILANLHNSDAIMQLLMAVDAIRQINKNTRIDLTIPYFPYARQDRVCNEGEAFSVKVMANLINQLACESVTVYDPHSQITVDTLDNCKVVTLPDIVYSSPLATIINKQQLTIISPDNGAKDKVQQVGKRLETEVLYAQKVRDSLSGNITGTEFHGNVTGKNCIILDDICDGGRTFIELSRVLKKAGASHLSLYVTHGIFSKGLDVFREHFYHLYCYHNLRSDTQTDPNFLTILQDCTTV